MIDVSRVDRQNVLVLRLDLPLRGVTNGLRGAFDQVEIDFESEKVLREVTVDRLNLELLEDLASVE